jgi:1-acyl-sn-glycerol-3-phosphate acyltransferase
LTSSALAIYHLARGCDDDARGCAFFAATGFLSLPISFVIFLSAPYTLLMDAERRQIPNWVQKTWGKGTTRCFFQARVEGLGHLSGLKGKAAVYISNHTSWLDIYTLFWVDPLALKIVARNEIFFIPLCGWVMCHSVIAFS